MIMRAMRDFIVTFFTQKKDTGFALTAALFLTFLCTTVLVTMLNRSQTADLEKYLKLNKLEASNLSRLGLESAISQIRKFPSNPAQFPANTWNTTPFFIPAGDLIQFNFKINKVVGKTNYEIKQTQVSGAKGFIKLPGTQGCKISSSTALFSAVTVPTASLEISFSNGYNATLDRLKYKYNGSSIVCGASPTTVFNNPNISELICSFDSSAGVLTFRATPSNSGSNWATIVTDIEYAPATSISSELLKGVSRTLSFKLSNTYQGNMTLDLYPLARSCADANFAP